MFHPLRPCPDLVIAAVAAAAITAGRRRARLQRSDGTEGCVTAFVIASLNKQRTLPENDDTPPNWT